MRGQVEGRSSVESNPGGLACYDLMRPLAFVQEGALLVSYVGELRLR